MPRILLLLLSALLGLSGPGQAQPASSPGQRTYCNPLNLDYGYTPIPNFAEAGRHRATADPVITLYKGEYYLFSTNQWGYWWSKDLYNWKFISRSFLKPQHKVYDDLCAPAVFVLGDTLLVFGSTHEKNFPIWMSTNPKANEWREAVEPFQIGAWDPAFFLDDDGKLYLYWGSSNEFPLYGQQISRKTFQPIGQPKTMFGLNDKQFGWQRFGEYLDNTFLSPFMEGAWMTKYQGKYYLQYGAPGTEFSGYADGVQISDKPLGPFTPQKHNPFAYKPGGFARGAGHGNTFQDTWGNWWHLSTMVISVKNNFERRLGLWPAGFDKDGVLYANTDFGDYPHYLPTGPEDHLKSRFTGWMLLNYQKPVQVSSTLGGYEPNYAVDESIKTCWSAATGNKGEYLQTDLGSLSTVHAIQINYADQDAAFLGKQQGIYHQYRLWESKDGRKWKVLVDKSRNQTDVPHDYIELARPVQTRYLKLENIHMPTGKFALSGLRIFGLGSGSPPNQVKGFVVLRTEKDKRSAWLNWTPSADAYAYNIHVGIAPDKLYSCIMVHGAAEYYFKGMDKDLPYYYTIEAINENGVSSRTSVLAVK
ncbi:family 43 glycosylhydrolase [Hymenobacter taeanensis]|uniref:Family 43 glycosylhydrolase n=1 Tax=Hymenobacter taeanensis TaxID=2735321 RepID=A0A6M6BL90_9BACT|nr:MULTISPECIES: family 43 glycosylhydrolase [Hymenobacter]QJX48886.1 family 43 glycosylhydrolase [Hymenobacter taeanensis]UOQ81601.1 family 43 glycosylhydrolase [Hymenobacter sp. 5414T-23]